MYKTLTLPLLATLFMHGLLLAVILINVPDSKPLVKKAPTKYIEAKLVTLEKPKAKPAAKPKPKAPSKDTAAEKQKAQQAEQERLKQQQLKEQQQKQAQLKQEQQAKQKAQQEKQRREEQARQQEQQRLAEQRKRLQEQQQQEFAELLEAESAARQAASDEELATSYIALISRVIQNNWDRPPSARNNMEAELALQLVPTGEVVSVRVINSSGNQAFDRSAEKAVLRAERFPELQQVPPRVFEKYFRRLNLIFRPEDLRL